MGEFDLIARYFTRPVRAGGAAALGVGDDCALLAPRPGMHLAVSSDMLVEGRHFFAGVDPRTLGHKALAVNLSDLAACGARPLAFTLALALPQADAPWLQAFADGLFALADAHGCELVAATPRAARSTCASPSSAKSRRARRCCAAARVRATTSGSAARWATRAWRLKRCAATSSSPPTPWRTRASGWSSPRRACSLASYCAASPAAPST